MCNVHDSIYWLCIGCTVPHRDCFAGTALVKSTLAPMSKTYSNQHEPYFIIKKYGRFSLLFTFDDPNNEMTLTPLSGIPDMNGSLEYTAAINWAHLADRYGTQEVSVADCSSCDSFGNLECESKRGQDQSLYVKDWHLARAVVSQGTSKPRDALIAPTKPGEFYDVPDIFKDDWTDDYYSAHTDDDFWFVERNIAVHVVRDVEESRFPEFGKAMPVVVEQEAGETMFVYVLSFVADRQAGAIIKLGLLNRTWRPSSSTELLSYSRGGELSYQERLGYQEIPSPLARILSVSLKMGIHYERHWSSHLKICYVVLVLGCHWRGQIGGLSTLCVDSDEQRGHHVLEYIYLYRNSMESIYAVLLHYYLKLSAGRLNYQSTYVRPR
ncbi:hypothetical protein BDY19DRAFT_909131 [Irpex rosettiformis]|uniref:Uncharacterized protein n=1 Tax=Irpex rosettiformis TaxID=378272 RepID=A0ACB8TTI3_9APHY|nr:hypothetical protein BDY19DRAFT_909131 [Irpex rosettiformis]